MTRHPGARCRLDFSGTSTIEVSSCKHWCWLYFRSLPPLYVW
jgi:hypothetical protein